MRILAGNDGTVHFTHLSNTSSTSLASTFRKSDAGKTYAQAETHTSGVLDLMKTMNVSLDRVCLLDPKAAKELSPADGDGSFAWFLFGVSVSLLHQCFHDG
jgi:ribosome biogenesis SPOUT family RNA methylase Rps3